jgi:hypothetical protein
MLGSPGSVHGVGPLGSTVWIPPARQSRHDARTDAGHEGDADARVRWLGPVWRHDRHRHHFLGLDTALIVHAVAAPIVFFAVSKHYFRPYQHADPMHTALAFIAVVVLVDFFVVGLAINQSLEMFTSLIGTWVPFALIFASSWLTGWQTARTQRDGFNTAATSSHPVTAREPTRH